MTLEEGGDTYRPPPPGRENDNDFFFVSLLCVEDDVDKCSARREAPYGDGLSGLLSVLPALVINRDNDIHLPFAVDTCSQ